MFADTIPTAEAIARIVDPRAFKDVATATSMLSQFPTSKYWNTLFHNAQKRVQRALAKANAILALLPDPAKAQELPTWRWKIEPLQLTDAMLAGHLAKLRDRDVEDEDTIEVLEAGRENLRHID